MPTLIASDFDGTLTRRDTLIEFIRYVHGTPALFWGFLLHLPLLVAMKLRLADNGRTKERIFSHFFRGMHRERFRAYGQHFAADCRHLLRPGGEAMVSQALAHGAEVVIVSASVREWVQPFFPEAVVVGTEVEIVDGRLTGRFATPNCYGPEKVARLQALYPHRASYRLIAYGDSRGDKQLLDYADESHYKPFR